MSTDPRTIQFICVRAAHHRKATARGAVCEHLGCLAYCPAGEIEHHDWLPTSTDLGSLGCLGFVRGEDDGVEGASDASEDRLVLTGS